MNMQPIAPLHAASRRNATAKPLNLVLQSAGSHGAFGWGVVDKLIEDGRVEIAAIAATGSGALDATIVAFGMIEGADRARILLEYFWRAMSDCVAWGLPQKRPPLSFLFAPAEPFALSWFEHLIQVCGPQELNPLNSDPIREALNATVDFAALQRSCFVKLLLCATNVRSGEARLFHNRGIDTDAVLASACLPAVSHAVRIDCEFYWDGAYSGRSLPGALAPQTPAYDTLIAAIAPARRPTLPRTAAEIQARVAELGSRIATVGTHTSERYVHMLRFDDVASAGALGSPFDTSWRALTRLRDLGRAAAELWLDAQSQRDLLAR